MAYVKDSLIQDLRFSNNAILINCKGNIAKRFSSTSSGPYYFDDYTNSTYMTNYLNSNTLAIGLYPSINYSDGHLSNTSDVSVQGTTYIGAGSDSISKQLILGVAGTTYFYTTSSTSGIAGRSDERDKIDFKVIERATEFIKKLRPVTFVDNHRDKYKVTEGEATTFDEESYKKQTLKGHRRIAGFIAQEVYQSMKDVYNDDNYAALVDYSKYDDPNLDEDRYFMRYDQLIPFITKSIQELSEKVNHAKEIANKIRAEIEEIKKQKEENNL